MRGGRHRPPPRAPRPKAVVDGKCRSAAESGGGRRGSAGRDARMSALPLPPTDHAVWTSPSAFLGSTSRLLKRRDRCHQLTVVTRNPGSMTPRHPESTLDPSSWLLSTSNARVRTYCQISRALTLLQDSDGIRAGALSSDCTPNWYYGARLLLRHS